MRKLRKFLIATLTAISFFAMSVPAMATEVDMNYMSNKSLIQSAVNQDRITIQSATSAYVTYEVYPTDLGGGSITNPNFNLSIPNYVNLNGNYRGRFEFYNIVNGWQPAGQGNLNYNTYSSGYYHWGLNTWFVLNYPNWRTLQYRYVY